MEVRVESADHIGIALDSRPKYIHVFCIPDRQIPWRASVRRNQFADTIEVLDVFVDLSLGKTRQRLNSGVPQYARQFDEDVGAR